MSADTPFGPIHPFKPGTAGKMCAECGWPRAHWLHNTGDKDETEEPQEE